MRALIAAAALLVCLAAAPGSAGPARAAGGPAAPAAPASAGITSVTATASAITVAGRLAPGTDLAHTSLELYELDPSQDTAAYPSLTPAGRVAAPLRADAFTLRAPRYSGGRDGYFDKFLVVARDGTASQAVGAPHYVDHAAFPARYSYPYPHGWDKKGISAVQMTNDAETLGASSSAVNVVVNDLMLDRDLGPASTITYWSGGRRYYFSRPAVASLDQQISALTRDRAYPYLILLITPHDPAASAGPQLRFPGAGPAASIDAFNTETAQGVAYLTAAMRFLAGRYLRADAAHGQAAGFIVGNEVDSAWIWQNMGRQPLGKFLEYYARAVRIVYQAAREAYQQPRVYISLDHEWAQPYVAGQPLQYYPGKEVVDGLAALTRAEGDFPWNIAYHPYPQNLFDPRFWRDDTQATDSPSSPLITFKNLQVLPAYLRQPSVTYDGHARRVILSEQGFNTADDSRQAQLLQAAAFAYAYYKVRFLDGIDAFLYYRHVDNQGEGGLRLGMWTWDPGRPEAGAPGQPKYIHNVYRYIDTTGSLQVTQFALPIIGITSWQQVIPGFNPAALAQRPLVTTAGTRVFARPRGERVLPGFRSGPGGWQPADNAGAVTAANTAGRDALVVHFGDGTPGALPLPFWSTEAKTAKGADIVFGHPVNATGTPWLDLAVRVPPPAPGQFKPGNTFLATVKVYGADGQVTEGLAPARPSLGWLPLSVDLAGWPQRRAVREIKVWVAGSTDDTWRGSYAIGQAGFSRSAVPSPGRTNLAITATAAIHSPQPGTAVSLSITNDDTGTLGGQLQAGTCPDVTVTPAAVSVDGLASGSTRTATVHLASYHPADPAAPQLCLSYLGERFTVPLQLPPPAPHTLYDFQAGTQGWQPAQNVARVTTVSSFPDGPGRPYQSGSALDATAQVVPASAEKSVAVTPAAPLDLSAADSFFAYLDCYGGAPGATGYLATITLSSGSQTLTRTVPVNHDSWNPLSVPLSAWPYRSRITRIEIGFQATGSDALWQPHFQLDDVGYTS